MVVVDWVGYDDGWLKRRIFCGFVFLKIIGVNG